MTVKKIQKKLKSLSPAKDIMVSGSGSEENVKIKFLIPLLKHLGYNPAKDMDFERLGADIVIKDSESNPLLIVEVKGWEKEIDNYLSQCLEYTLKLKTPYVMITSGSHSAIYCTLINPEKLTPDNKLYEFSFMDLKQENNLNKYKKINSLISKESLLSGADELLMATKNKLKDKENIEDLRDKFNELSENFESEIKSSKLTDEQYKNLASQSSEDIRDAFLLGLKNFKNISNEYKNVNLRYRSKEIGLEFRDRTGPRTKNRGLVGLYPEREMIAFGIETWQYLFDSDEILEKIENFPRQVKDKEQIIDLADLLESALNKLEK